MDIIKAALYIRVSTEEQVREGYSLDAQKAHLLEYAKKQEYSVVGLYTDEGISARKSYTKRPAFMRLLSDVESGKIDIILFIKLDRWFRSVADYYKAQEILDAHKVGWRATLEQYDTTTASGRLYINIRLAIAQDEADRTSERIKFVFDRKVAESQIVSGRLTFGYKIENDKLVIDEDNAAIVRRIFDVYLTLRSMRATMLKINEETGQNISYCVVSHILSNERYIGKYRDNRNYCPPIIDTALFDEVQNSIKTIALRSHSAKKSYFYIFTGLLICPCCGYKLSGSGVGNSSHYRYYRCMAHHRSSRSCTFNKTVSEEKLEQYLLNNIANEIDEYKVSYEISRSQPKKQTISRVTIENKLAKLRELYVNDLINIADYKREYELLNEKLKEIESIPDTSKKDFSNLNSLLSSDFANMYQTLDNRAKRALWHTVIEKIEVTEDKKFHIFFK